MTSRGAVLGAVVAALGEINELLPADAPKAELSEDEILVGRGSKLDSLLLVQLIASVEQRMADDVGVPVTIADERAMSQKSSPFRTVRSLTDYVLQLANEAAR